MVTWCHNSTIWCHNSCTMATINRKYTWLHFMLLSPSGYSVWGSKICWKLFSYYKYCYWGVHPDCVVHTVMREGWGSLSICAKNYSALLIIDMLTNVWGTNKYDHKYLQYSEIYDGSQDDKQLLRLTHCWLYIYPTLGKEKCDIEKCDFQTNFGQWHVQEWYFHF